MSVNIKLFRRRLVRSVPSAPFQGSRAWRFITEATAGLERL